MQSIRIASRGKLVNRIKASVLSKKKFFSSNKANDLFNPTDEHLALRQMVRSFVETEVDPQAQEYNRAEKFNMDLFRKLGSLGLLGVTVPSEYGGSAMDCTAAVIVHGK